MKSDIHLSVIIPVYNSGSFLENSLNEIEKFLNDQNFTSELLIVDDGSTDNSLSIAQKWAIEPRRFLVSVISLGKNMGKGAGVAKGMLAAKGEYSVFLDSDMAYEPLQILSLLRALEGGSDLALACRVHPDSRYTISPKYFNYLYTRHLASRLINWFLRCTIIPHCNDSQAGLKGFRSEAAKKIFSQQIIQGFSFDIEALYLAEQMKMSIKEVPIDYQYAEDQTTVAFLQDGLGIIRDIIKIHLHKLGGKYKISD